MGKQKRPAFDKREIALFEDRPFKSSKPAVPLRFPNRECDQDTLRFVTGITRPCFLRWSFEEERVTELSVGDSVSLAAIESSFSSPGANAWV